MITRGTNADIRYYGDFLINEYIHFLDEVLFDYEDKCRSKGKKVFKVSFDSRVLENQKALNYTGYATLRYKQVKYPKKERKPLGNNIVLIVPAFAIENDAIAALQNEFPGFIESDELRSEHMD